MQNIRTRLAKGVAWIAATRVVVNVTGFASTLILARLLIPDDFGLVAIATTVYAVISSFTELSLSSALIHHSDPREEHFHSAFTLSLLRSTTVSLAILAISVPMSHAYRDPRLVQIMIALSVAALLGGLVNPKLIILSRELIFWQEFVLGVVQKLGGFVVSLSIAALYRSYWALVAGILTTQVIYVVLSYILLPYRPRFHLRQSRELMSFSIWLSLGQAVNTLNWRFDYLVVGYFLGNTSLGFYTVGDNLSQLPTREATTPIAQTLFPAFSKLREDVERLRRAYMRGQSLLCAIALPIGCCFAILARPLIILVMGPKWLPTVFVVQVLASVLAIQTLASPLQPLAMALGETKKLFQRDVVNFLVRIPLVALGLLFGGFPGIVLARSVSGLISTAINMRLTMRLIHLPVTRQLIENHRTLVGVTFMMAGSLLFGSHFGNKSDPVSLLIEIVTRVSLAGLLYVSAVFVIWRIEGSPEGAETEVVALVSRIANVRQRKPRI